MNPSDALAFIDSILAPCKSPALDRQEQSQAVAAVNALADFIKTNTPKKPKKPKGKNGKRNRQRKK